MRRVHIGPLIGLACTLALVAGLRALVDLTLAALTAGAACAAVTWVLLERGMRHTGLVALGPANRVTLVRASLTALVTALVVESWATQVSTALVVGLGAVALALDAVDGWLARRGSETRLGASFDMETDAFLILVLSVYLAPDVGWWVLAIGLARYLLLVAGWVRPWLTEDSPARWWAKVVAALQGVVLVVAASGLLAPVVSAIALGVAAALLAESFGRQVWWLHRRRHESMAERPRWLRPALDLGAVGLVWLALMVPHRPSLISIGAVLGIPLELLVFLVLALVLPTVPGRVMAVVAGLLLAASVLVSGLDLGFYVAFDRPFDPLTDPGYARSGLDLLHSSFGRAGQVTVLVVIGAGLGLVTSLSLWGTLRARRAAHSRTVRWRRSLAALTVVWLVAGVSGAQVDGVPVAAAPAASLLRLQVDQLQGDLRDRARFERQLAADPYAAGVDGGLLRRLRGKDVLLVFVEAYGRVATRRTWFAPQVDATLHHATRRLADLGFHARSSYLRSPTFGGISWLAHSTLQSGVWVDSQQRYDQLLGTQRFTLSEAFRRSGWRTVSDIPSDGRTWPEGKAFYHFRRMYGGSDVGYIGPSFSYAAVPDQYTFAALDRNELQPSPRRPVMAEIDLVSSHTPWTPLPHIVPWADLGDGSVFDGMHESDASLFHLVRFARDTQGDYARSIRYTLRSLVSFVQHAGDKTLVMVVLGDHQPHTVVSGPAASHDVPISLIAHDPRVLRRISSWNWSPGLLPSPRAGVLRMDRFRNRFLTAFSAPTGP